MKEVEVLVRIDETDVKKALSKLEKIADYKSKKHVIDTYFYDELRGNLKPDKNFAIFECFRTRNSDGKYYVTYKVDKFDENNKWLYSDESETSIGDMNEMFKIIKNLGLKQLVEVDMTKHYFETKDYTIALEVVKNLGAFLEVESKKGNIAEKDIASARKEIEKFIKSLDVQTSPDLGMGKPEMLLKKLNGVKF